MLKDRGLTVTAAESCTGGLVSCFLTDVDGSSDYFKQGVVTYCNGAKNEILGVPRGILNTVGPVSPQTAIGMAQGVRKWAGADIGISTTGLAGPQGEPGKPVGLVYIGLSSPKGTFCVRYLFKGGRLDIKHQAALAALEMLRQFLVKWSEKN